MLTHVDLMLQWRKLLATESILDKLVQQVGI